MTTTNRADGEGFTVYRVLVSQAGATQAVYCGSSKVAADWAATVATGPGRRVTVLAFVDDEQFAEGFASGGEGDEADNFHWAEMEVE
jgi:hypothetical protein